MNKTIMIANLCSDPELKTTASGISVATFRIAVRRPYQKDKTDYFTVVVWRQLAEVCAQWLKKGHRVGVVGYLSTRDYDGKDGIKRYITEIVADDVEFLTPKSEGAAKYEPPADGEGLFGDEPDDFEPLDDEQMPF